MANFEALKGQTIISIVGLYKESGEVKFQTLEGNLYRMFHLEDCCEVVVVDDVNGEIADILESPILLAEERSEDAFGSPEGYDSGTWTFYVLETIKGRVTIKWLGTSNGYYSESVDFELESSDV